MGIIKWSFRTLLLGVFLNFLQLATSEIAQTNGTSPRSGVANDGDKRPIVAGIEPFYVMTEGFLNLLSPKEYKPQFNKVIYDVAYNVSKGKQFDQNDLRPLYTSIAGYTACVIVGLAFILGMILGSIVFCCCRCCGNCGAKVHDKENRRSKCIRISCGTLLLAFATIMLAATVLTFLTTQLLWEQTTDSPDAVIPQTVENMESLSTYIKSIKTEISSVGGELNDTLRGVKFKIYELPTSAVKGLDNQIKAEIYLAEAKELADKAVQINSSLTDINLLVSSLQTKGNQLTANLAQLAANVTQTMGQCSTAIKSQCDSIKTKVDNVERAADFSKVSDLGTELNNVQQVLQDNLAALIQKAKNDYQGISVDIKSKIKTELEETIREVDIVNGDVIKKIKQIENSIQTDEMVKEIDKLVQELQNSGQKQVSQYGNYLKYAGIAIGCIQLIAVLFFFLGLSCGMCGEPPDSDGSTCNRETGAIILLCGILWSFIVSWILMIVVIILFLPGGTLYTEGCRFLKDPKSTAGQDFLRSLDPYINISSLSEGKIQNRTFSQVLLACQDNKGLYTVLNLQNVFNVHDAVNLDNYGSIKSKLDQVNQVTVDIGRVTILDATTEQQLKKLKDANLDQINFSPFYNEVNKKVYTGNLTQLATEMDTLANQLSTNGYQSLANQVEFHRQSMMKMDVLIKEMQREKTALYTAVSRLDNLLDADFSTKIANLITELTQLSDNFRNNGNTLVKKALVDAAKSLYAETQLDLNKFADRLVTEKARCSSLNTIYNSQIYIICDGIMDPLNAFWFSIGWCIAFMVPTIIVAIILNIEYKKYEDEDMSENKSFDDPRTYKLIGHRNRYAP